MSWTTSFEKWTKFEAQHSELKKELNTLINNEKPLLQLCGRQLSLKKQKNYLKNIKNRTIDDFVRLTTFLI